MDQCQRWLKHCRIYPRQHWSVSNEWMNNATDGTGPAGQVCTAMNLRPVTFKAEGAPDLQLGLPATFTEVAPMIVALRDRWLDRA